MKLREYRVKVLEYDEFEDIVIVLINNITLKCFSFNLDSGLINVGDLWVAHLQLLDFDIDSLKEVNSNRKGVTCINSSLAYLIEGKYNAETQSIDIGFTLDLDSKALYDFSYLDNKTIQIKVLRFDIDFVRKIAPEY